MFASRLAVMPVRSMVNQFVVQGQTMKQGAFRTHNVMKIRLSSNQPGFGSRHAKRRTLKEQAMAPAGEGGKLPKQHLYIMLSWKLSFILLYYMCISFIFHSKL